MKLRPLERRLLHLLSEGKSYDQLSSMFRRSPQHLERCVKLIDLKIDQARKEP